MARLSENLPTGRTKPSSTRQSSYFNELRLQPVKGTRRKQATYCKTLQPHVRDAVHAFVSLTSEHCGADEQPFKLLRQSFSAWARENRFADLSDKVLGIALQEAGCRKRTVDKRRSGKGCFVVYQLPEAA